MLKVEPKEEETIHDSDFEEPSGLFYLLIDCFISMFTFSILLKGWKGQHFRVVYQLTNCMQMKLLGFQILSKGSQQHRNFSFI